LTKIFAHRGYRALYPENTMLSFRKAVEHNVNGIELDVQLTSDGEVIILHDETLDRTTNGSGYVKDVDFKTLQELDAGHGENIPSLIEYLEFIRNFTIITNIELKNNIVPYDGMEEKVLCLVKEYKLSDRLILSSFNIESVKKLSSLAPEIPRGFITDEISNPAELAALMRRLGIKYLHPSLRCYWNHRDSIIREGFIVNIWTVNNKAELRRLSQDGVFGVFTDNPKILDRERNEN